MQTSTEGRVERRSHKWPEIALIGAYPPPYGGIGVHLQRLVERLEDADADFALYNTVSGAARPPHVRSVARHRGLWFLGFCVRHHCSIVHLVSTHWYSHLLFGVTACLRRGTYVLSIHNMTTNDAMQASGFLRPRLTRWFLRRMDSVVACNPEIARACVETAGVAPERVRLIPAFIPPAAKRVAPLPEYVDAFIRAHAPVLSTLTWRLGITHRGHDLYGTDMLVDLIDRLKADYPSVGLVMTCLGGEADVVDRTLRMARARAGDSILMITEPLEDVSPLLKVSDLFLRPTNTDGDANSIREALSLGTPVVASDVVPRPEPCMLFRTRDMDDFEKTVRTALRELPALNRRVSAHTMTDNAALILELYATLKEGPQ